MSVESEFFTKLQAFETSAMNLSRIFEDLDSNASDAVATQYPFKESFEEVSANILFWRENVRTQFKEMGFLIPELSTIQKTGNRKVATSSTGSKKKKIKKTSLESVINKLLDNGLIDEILTEKEQERVAIATRLLKALEYVVNSEYDRDGESRNFEEDTLAEFEELIKEAHG